MKTMATRGTGNETYFDSAAGETISRARAIQELAGHGIDKPEELQQFYKECGYLPTYKAQDVLCWLGY